MKITDKLDECLTYIQARNPDCQVAYSSIFKRKDNPEFNKCGQEVNDKIKERLMQRGIDFIDNSNILFNNLYKDGLHLSTEGGVQKYCKNLSNYLRYSMCSYKGINSCGDNPLTCGNIEPSQAANSSNFDLGYLKELCKECAKNPIIGYLNINSLRNKIVDLRQVLYEGELDILAVSETKLSDEFPNLQFNIEGYYDPAQLRKDRTIHGDGVIVYVKTGVPVKRVHALEPANLEVICFEITIAKRKWLIYSFYRSETFTQLPKFLEELKKSVDMAINKYENIILMGDINVEMSSLNELNVNFYDVNEFCDIFSLTNLIKRTTCLTPTAKHPSLIDIILTNRPRSFKNSVAIETGPSDHHKMVVTVLKCHFVRIQPKTIHYRDYHQFSPDAFIADLILRNVNSLPVSTLDPNKAYTEFCDTFKTILDKHAPLKSKVLRGNHAPFITKELSKGIMTRSRLKNKFNRHRTKENWNAYKIQRNNCVQLRKNAIKSYFEQNTKSGDVSNKLFWKTIRPFSAVRVLMITMT